MNSQKNVVNRVGGAELLASIVDSADDAILSKDLNGIVTSWNRGAELIFGYTAEEMIGQLHRVAIPAERKQEENEIQERILRGELISHFETVRLHKSGRPVPVSLSISPVKGPGGEIIGSSAIARDITEHRRTEEQLRLLVGALEAAANGVVITDQNAAILWVNRAFGNLTGYSPEEVIGKSTRVLKSGKHDKSFYADMWTKISGGEVWRGELINKRKDGTCYPEEMMITPVRATAGNVTHYIAIKHDITERLKAAAEREELIQKLQQAALHVKTLTGLLPICASCKKIREDSGYWSQVEVYVQQHSNAHFTHGICPDCARNMMAELEKLRGPNRA